MAASVHTLEEFLNIYEDLYKMWGYRHEEANPNYEAITHSGNLRSFQSLTDFLMRYLQQKYVFECDMQKMNIETRDFTCIDAANGALQRYLDLCGPFFKDTEQTCICAYEYLLGCDQNEKVYLLRISLK